MKKLISFLTILLAVLMLAAVPVSASSAYQTYTYSIDGEPLYSPDAYSAKQSIDAAYMGMEDDFKNPSDLCVDDQKNVYIVDSGNNRVVILDQYYKLKTIISEFINDQGVPDTLNNPQGIFISDDRIWICDTDSNRIVIFNRDFTFKNILEAPESALFDEGSIYKPVAIAVDRYNRLFVVSSTTYQGIIILTEDGQFQNFIGAQAVSITVWQKLWRRFQTKEQRTLTKSYVSTEYNNIAINEDGLIYCTTSSIDEADAATAVQQKGSDGTIDGTYLPVKQFNTKGDEIMRRTGFWPPAGEIQYSTVSSEELSGPSTIVDVAVGPDKTWTIIDQKRSKIYTYDFNGNLLFAFGDNTSMLGSVTTVKAVDYQGTKMLVLDSSQACFVVYERTEYGDILLEAIAAQNSLDYDYAISCWKKVLQHNSNFDAAYVGIGQAYYRNGDYQESLEYFTHAYDTTNWSNSYKEARKDWMSKGLIPVLVGIIVLLVVVSKLFGKLAKHNAAVAISGKKITYWDELAYGFHVIMHPFDGFWDLKHEKRGSVRASLTFIAMTMLIFFYQDMAEGYVMDPYRDYMFIWVDIISVGLPLLLFIIANWCLTTLFDGEGSFKDVVIASGYALLPVTLITLPATILSNYVTDSEKGIITFLLVVGYVWMGLLLVAGTQVTHDYTTGKNFVTILGTIVGIAFLMFIAVLFSTLIVKLVSFVVNIVKEVQYRM